MAKTKGEILKLAEQCIQLSEGDDDSTNSDDRAEAYKYYYGEPFGNERDGRSDYVSRDVFDAVEDAKEILLEVFGSNRETVKFTPQDQNDVLQAKLRTSYCNRVFNKNNSGYSILHDSIQDALLAKNCTAKVYWNEETEYKTEQVQGIMPEAYEQLESSEAEIVEAVQDEVSGLIDAELRVPVDASRVAVEVIAPERVVRDPNATDPSKARFWGEKSEVTRSELIEMGFDSTVVAGLTADGDSQDEMEEQAREGVTTGDDLLGEPSQETLELYELFIWWDDEGDGVAQLHQVFKVGNTILETEEVQRMPYFSWAALRVAHRYDGLSTYDIIGDIQKLKSTIKRQIVDNLLISNNQSRVARQGAFVNPADWIDNPVGATHWLSKTAAGPITDHVMATPAPQLTPLTMPALEMLNQDKEHRVGVSRLTSGLNQDVISNQNADDMINRMTSAAMRRMMGMARRYAELFLIPIFQEIYTLALEHDQKGLLAEVDGEWQQLNPQEMGEGVDMEVTTALTPDDAEMRARTLMVLHNSLTQGAQMDPSLQAIYLPQNKYSVLREIFKLSGQPSPEFLTDPNSTPAQLQQQLMQTQQQLQQMTMQNQQLQAVLQQFNQQELDVKVQDAQTRQVKAMGELDLKRQKQMTDASLGDRKQSLAEDAEAHDQTIDELELALERRQDRNVSI
ncbi:portal protein [Microbulbifer epialgicus]|uniref:Portal protein n=1 Tax=Microbulbifer epialgicus TaxID=393907 RepID=A0ABV4P6E0_9GAMM